MSDNRLDNDKDRELERLLALANLQRMRGQWADAEETLSKASAMVPDDPEVLEMHGDILYECGKVEAARDTYHKVLELHPGDKGIESKYAKAVLEIAEEEREKIIAQDMLENPQLYIRRERKPGSALLLSLIPGLGQFYNQEIIKAVIIWGIFILFFIILAIFQTPYRPGTISIQDFISQTHPLILVLGFLAFFAYIYGLIDAPISADKISKSIKKRIEG